MAEWCPIHNMPESQCYDKHDIDEECPEYIDEHSNSKEEPWPEED
jgi:hypothetical protein